MRVLFFSAAILGCLAFVMRVQSQDSLPQPGPDAESQPEPGGRAAPAAPDAATYRQQTSYALGRNFAANLRDNEIQCDLQYLFAGISDMLQAKQPRWTDEQLEATMRHFGQEMEQKAQARIQRQAVKNQQEATAFLAQNAKREGVQTTASGLQYRVVRQGEGPSPTLGDRVRCNYRGTLLNGTEFDNSAAHGGPAEFRVDEPIPGWIEALQKMHVGDKWQLFVPPNLGYEMNPPGPPIEPNSLLVFEIELLEIVQQ
jgi:FKBP-type peptidyl-prolyl cis-trans isomerase